MVVAIFLAFPVLRSRRQTRPHQSSLWPPEHGGVLWQTLRLGVVGQRVQGAPGEHFHHMPPIACAAADVVDGAGRRSGQRSDPGNGLHIEALATQRILRSCSAQNRRRDTAQHDRRPRNQPLLQSQHHGHIDDRDSLGAAQPQFQEDAALCGQQRRKSDFRQHFVRAHHRATQPCIEIRQRDAAFALSRAQRNIRAQRHQWRDGVVGGRAGDEVAGDGGAVANLRRTDFPGGLHQGQTPLAQRCAAHHMVVCYQRAQMEIPAALFNAIQPGHARDIHQLRHAGTLPALQLNEHVRAARDDTCPFTLLRQQGQRLIKTAYAMVILPHASRPSPLANLYPASIAELRNPVANR